MNKSVDIFLLNGARKLFCVNIDVVVIGDRRVDHQIRS